MNASLISRFTALGIACTMTLVMLLSINSLATSQPSPQLLARMAASAVA